MKVGFYSYHAYDVVHSPTKSAGGMELQVLLLGRELMKRGIEVEYFVGDSGQEDLVEEEGLIFRKIFQVRNASPFAKLLFFAKAIRSSGVNLVVERGSSETSGMLYAVSRILGVRYIFAAASDINCDRNSHDLSSGGGWRRWSYQLAVKRAAEVVLQKRSQRELLRTTYNREGIIIRSLALRPEGISIGDIEERQTVIWISNLHQYKQPGLFLELARRIPDRRFVMAGGARDPEFGRAVADSARQIPNLDFRGFVPQAEVWSLLARARVLVNTTVVEGKYEEGFPNTFLQSWALGVPVVSLISDPDHILMEKGVGKVSRSIERMENDIRALFASDAEWEQMSKRCRRLFAAEFETDATVEAYLSLFEQCERAT